MSSLTSRLFFGLLKIINLKGIISSLAAKKKPKHKPFFSKREIKQHNILKISMDKSDIWTIGADSKSSRHIIYFHGGMYVIEGTGLHKRWLFRLFHQADCKITYIHYPLAPEHKVNETLQMVVDSYQFLAEQFPDDHFILMGDSAGGGLALVLAQYLRDYSYKKQPEKSILYSPWVRLDMENQEIQEITQRDVLLDLHMLEKSAKQYAGDLALTHSYLSPYYNSCQDLGEMYVFYGCDELLAPDIKLLERKCIKAHAKARFYCYEGMQHVFHLFTFLPESREIFRRTIGILIN